MRVSRWSIGCAVTSSGSGRAILRRSSRWCSVTRQPRSQRRTRSSPAACSSRRSGRPPSRRALRGCASRCRPPTRRSRWTRWPTRWPRSPVPAPAEIWLIAGTATEVGKKWVATGAARSLRAGGACVAARKPAQSLDADDAARGATDADLLAAATGEPVEVVCPRHRWYEVAMAPPMAAAALGRPPFTVADLVDELRWPDGGDVGLVETAGGVRSPIADDGDTV